MRKKAQSDTVSSCQTLTFRTLPKRAKRRWHRVRMIRKRKRLTWNPTEFLRHWATYFGWTEEEYQKECVRETARHQLDLRRVASFPSKFRQRERDWMNNHRLQSEKQARRDLQNQSDGALYVKGCRRNQKDLFIP